MRPIIRWCCILVSFAARKAESLVVVQGRELPQLISYQSDGWTTAVASKVVANVGPIRFTRTGRAKKELLLERSVHMVIDPDTGLQKTIGLTPPRPMDHGVSCWHISQASCDHHETLRAQGAKGLTFSHYLQDGLHATGFLRHHVARHRLYYNPDLWSGSADERWDLLQQDIVHGGRCKLHIGSNAIKWGMKPLASEETY